MATEGEFPEPISVTEKETEDKEVLSGPLNTVHHEQPPDKMEKVEPRPNKPLEPTNYVGETENMRISIATNIDVDNVNAVTKGDVGTIEGQQIVESPSIPKVATEETSSVPKEYEAAKIPNPAEREMSENETLGEEKLKDKYIETVANAEASSKEHQQNTEEEFEGSQKDEKGGIMTDETGEIESYKHIVNILEATSGQNAGGTVHTSDLIEDSNTDSGKLREACNKEDSADNNLSTKIESSDDDLRETSYQGGEDKESEMSITSDGKEIYSIKPSEEIEDEENETQKTLQDSTKDVQISTMTESPDDQYEEEARENGAVAKENLGSPLITALIKETSSEKDGPDEGEKLEENFSITFDVRSQKTVVSSEKKDATSIEDNIQDKNLISSFVRKIEDKAETSKEVSEMGSENIVKMDQNEIPENFVTADSNINTRGNGDENPEPKVDVLFTRHEESSQREREELASLEASTREDKYKEGFTVSVSEDSIETEEHSTTETLKQKEISDQSFMPKDELGKENLERSLNVDSEEIEKTAFSQHTETITYFDEQRPVESFEEVLKQEKKEKTLYADDIKTESPEETTLSMEEFTVSVGEDSIKTEGHSNTETSKHKEISDQSFLPKDELGKENLERSLNVDSEEIEKTAFSQHAETITFFEEQGPVESFEEVLEEEKKEKTPYADDIKKESPEETNLSMEEMNVKIKSAVVDIPDKTANDSYVTHPLVEETVQLGDEKKDEVSSTEPEDQICKGNTILTEVEKNVNEAYEVSRSPEIVSLEHSSTEGAPNMELTSRTAKMDVDKLEMVCQLNCEENLQVKDVGDYIKEEIQQKKEASDTELQKIATKSDDNEKSRTEEDVPVKYSNTVCTTEEDQLKCQEDENIQGSSNEVASELNIRDESCRTDNDTLNEEETPVAADEDEDTENQIIHKEHSITGHSPESTGVETSACCQEDDMDAEKPKLEMGEELETTSAGQGITEQVQVEENKIQEQALASTGEEIMAENLKEDEMMEKVSKQEVLEKTDEGQDTIAPTIKETDSSQDCSTESFEEKTVQGSSQDVEASEEYESAIENIKTQNQKMEESVNANHPPSTVGEEITTEEERGVVKLKEEVKNSVTESKDENFDATCPTEETQAEALKDGVRPNQDCDTKDTTGTSKETPPKGTSDGHVENSSVPCVSEKESKEEILEKAEPTVTGVTEGTSLKEVEREEKMQSDNSDLTSAENGLATIGKPETESDDVDITAKQAEASDLGESKNIQILTAAKDRADEVGEKIDHEAQNETHDTLPETKDEREVSTGETPLDYIPEQNLKESSAMSSRENNLMTTEVSETTDETPEKVEAYHVNTLSPLVGEKSGERLLKIEEESMDPNDTASLSIEKAGVNEKVHDEDQQLYMARALGTERSITESEELELQKRIKTGDVANYSDIGKLETLKDEKSLNTELEDQFEDEKPVNDASNEASSTCADTEKAIVEEENSARNLKSSLKEDVEIEKEVIDVEETDSGQDCSTKSFEEKTVQGSSQDVEASEYESAIVNIKTKNQKMEECVNANHPPSTVGEEIMTEEERGAVKLKKEVKNSVTESIDENFDTTCPTEETKAEALKDGAKQNQDCHTQDTTGTSKETPLKGTSDDHVENSSVPCVSEKESEEEILEKAEPTVTGVTEGTSLKDVEQEEKMQSDNSDLTFEENGLATIGKPETESDDADITAKQAEASDLGANKNLQILTAVKDGADEAGEKIDHEAQNETHDTLPKRKDEREVSTGETPLDYIPDQNLKESSALSSRKNNLMTTEVSDTTDETPEKVEDCHVNTFSPLAGEKSGEKVLQIEEESMDPNDTASLGIEKSGVNEEVHDEDQQLYMAPALSTERSITESEVLEIQKSVKTGEVANYSDIGKLETIKDEKSLNTELEDQFEDEKTVNDASNEACSTCTDTKKAIVEEENCARNLKSSLKEDVETEKEVIDVEETDSGQDCSTESFKEKTVQGSSQDVEASEEYESAIVNIKTQNQKMEKSINANHPPSTVGEEIMTKEERVVVKLKEEVKNSVTESIDENFDTTCPTEETEAKALKDGAKPKQDCDTQDTTGTSKETPPKGTRDGHIENSSVPCLSEKESEEEILEKAEPTVTEVTEGTSLKEVERAEKLQSDNSDLTSEESGLATIGKPETESEDVDITDKQAEASDLGESKNMQIVPATNDGADEVGEKIDHEAQNETHDTLPERKDEREVSTGETPLDYIPDQNLKESSALLSSESNLMTTEVSDTTDETPEKVEDCHVNTFSPLAGEKSGEKVLQIEEESMDPNDTASLGIEKSGVNEEVHDEDQQLYMAPARSTERSITESEELEIQKSVKTGEVANYSDIGKLETIKDEKSLNTELEDQFEDEKPVNDASNEACSTCTDTKKAIVEEENCARNLKSSLKEDVETEKEVIDVEETDSGQDCSTESFKEKTVQGSSQDVEASEEYESAIVNIKTQNQKMEESINANHPPSTVGEEIMTKEERVVVKLKEEVKSSVTESIDENFDTTCPTEETKAEEQDCDTQDTTGTSKETPPKGTRDGHIEKSSVPCLSEKESEEEILEKAEPTVTGVTEGTSLKEVEREEKLQSDNSDLTSEESGLATIGKPETESEDVDITDKQAEASDLGESKNMQILPAANDGADEVGEKIDHEAQNETHDTLPKRKDEREVSTGETPLDYIPEQNLKESSALLSSENNLMTTEVSETTDETPEKVEDYHVNTLSPLAGEKSGEKVLQIEEESMDPNDAASLGIEKDGVNEKVHDEDQQLYMTPPLNTERSLTESEELELQKSVKTGEVASYSDIGKLEILKDEKNTELEDKFEDEKPVNDASNEVCNTSTDTKKAIVEEENSARNLKSSLKEDVEMEKEVIDVEAGGHSHKIEVSETETTSTITKQNPVPVEPTENLRCYTESLVEDQTLREKIKTKVDEGSKSVTNQNLESTGANINGQDFQGGEREVNEEVEPILQAENQINKTQDGIDTLKNEVLPEEVSQENSSVPQVSEKTEEKILEKAVSTDTGVTEEISLKEVEEEDKMQLDSNDPASEEEGMETTGKPETGTDDGDIIGEACGFGETKNVQIPIAAKVGANEAEEKTEREVQNETHGLLPESKDDSEVSTAEMALDYISEQNFKESSALSATEHQLVTTEVSETTDETPEKIEAYYVNTHSPLAAETTEEKLLQKEDESMDPRDDSHTASIAIEKDNENEEVHDEDQKMYTATALNTQQSIIDSQDETSLTELEKDKSEDENSVNNASNEACNSFTDAEKTILEQEDCVRNIKSILKEDVAIEKEVVDVEAVGHGHEIEVSETKITSNITDENPQSVEQLRCASESVAEDQSKKTLPVTNKTKIEEGNNTEEVPGTVEKAEESENIKKIVEEEIFATEIQATSASDETVNKITDPDPVPIESLEPIDSSENEETVKSQAAEDLSWESEASSVTKAPEEETKEHIEKPNNVTSSTFEVSEEKTKEENKEEPDTCNDKTDLAPVTRVAEETSSEEVQQNDKAASDFGTTSDGKNLGIKPTNTSIQDEEAEGAKLEETSGTVSQLTITECDNAESVIVEKPVEVEEPKTSDAISKSKEMDLEDIHKTGKSPTVDAADTDKLEEEINEVLEPVSKPTCQGVEAVIEGYVIPDQTLLAGNLTEQLQEPSCAMVSKEQDREITTEKLEEESTKKDETLVNEILEGSFATSTKVETCLQKGEPKEIEVSKLEHELIEDKQNDSLDEAPKEEITALEESAAVEPQENVSKIEYADSPSETGKSMEFRKSMHSSSQETSKEDTLDSWNSNKEIADLPIPHSVVKEALPGEGGEKWDEASNLDFQKTGKVLESMSKVHIPELLRTSEETEMREERIKAATTESAEENQSDETNEANETIKNEISSEKITEEKEVAKDSEAVSLDEETIRKKYQQDKLEAVEYPGEKTSQEFETTKNSIQNEELSEENEKVNEEKNIKKHIMGEDTAAEDPYQDSVGDGTVDESLPQEAEGKNVEEAPFNLDHQKKSDETNCKDTNTEAMALGGEANGSEIELVKHDGDMPGTIDKETVILNDTVQNPNLEVPPVAESVIEEAPREDVGEEVGEVSEPAHKEPIFEPIETYEVNKGIAEEDTQSSESLMDVEKPKHTHLESASDENDVTEGMNLIKQAVSVNENVTASPIESLQREIEEKENENTVDEKQHDIVSDNQITDEASMLEEGKCIKDKTEHIKYEETVDLSTRETQLELDEAEEVSNPDFEKSGKVLESMSDVYSPEQLQESEETEMKEEHIEEAATTESRAEENQSGKTNEANETIKNEISSEKYLEEKEGAKDSGVVFLDEETIRKNYQEDKIEAVEYPGEQTSQEFKTTKKSIQNEELSEELQRASEEENIKKQLMGEDGAVEDPYQDSVGDGTVDENLPQEAEGKNVKEVPINIDIQKKSDETNFRDTNTEAMALREEVSSSEDELAKCDEDSVAVIEKETVIRNDEEVQNSNLEIPPVTDAVAEEAPHEDVGEEMEKVSKPAPKEPIFEKIETYQVKNDNAEEDTNGSESHMNDEKPKHTPLESEFDGSDVTEDLNQKAQVVCANEPATSSPTESLQKEIAEKENENTVDEKQHDVVSDKQSTDEVSIVEEGKCIKNEGDHIKDEELVELSTRERKMKLDEAEEASNLDVQKTGKVLESMSEVYSPEKLHKSEEVEMKDEHIKEALESRAEENQSGKTNESNETLKNEMSSEKITEEKEVVKDSEVVSLGEETIRKNYQDDKPGAVEYPGEKTSQEFETTKNSIQNEELSEELERASEEENITKRVMGEEGAVEDPYPNSVGDGTVDESLPQEAEGKNAEEAPINLDLQKERDETDASTTNTEVMGLCEEVNSSEVELEKHDEERAWAADKHTVIRNDKVQNTNLEVPPVTDLVIEEAPCEDLGGVEEVTESAPKEAVFETIETDEEKKDIAEKDTHSSERLMGDEKLKHTPLESAFDGNDVTKDFKEQAVSANEPGSLSPNECLQKEIAEKENENTVDEKQHDFVSDKQITDEVSMLEEEKCNKDKGEHIKYEETVELSTRERQLELDEAEEDSNLEIQKTGKVLESMSEVYSPEKPQKSEETEMKKEHIKEATTELRAEENARGKTNENIKNDITSEKITEEKEVVRDSEVVSLDEETIGKNYQDDKLEAGEYPGEKISEEFETTKKTIQNEELSEELERAGVEQNVKKQVVEEDKDVEDPYQYSVGDGTVDESLPQEAEGKTVEEAPVNLDLQKKSDETNCKATDTEATALSGEVKSSEVGLVKRDEESIYAVDKETVRRNDEDLQNSNLEVPPVADSVAEQAPHENLDKEVEEVTEPSPKEPIFETTETDKMKKDIVEKDANSSESRMGDDRSDVTKELNLKEEAVSTNEPGFLSPIESLQKAIAEKKNEKIMDEKQHDFVSDKNITDEVSTLEEGKCTKDEREHEKNEEPVELSTSERKQDNDSDMEISQKYGMVDLTKASESVQDVQKLEKASVAISDKEITVEPHSYESTKANISTGNKDVPLVQQDPIAKIFQTEVEDLEPGNVSVAEPEAKGVECAEEKGIGDDNNETTDKFESIESAKMSLSSLLQRSTKRSSQVAENLIVGRELTDSAELQADKAETAEVEEAKRDEDKDEEEDGDENKKADSGSDAPVMVEASRDMDVKVAVHKKSHNILSGVGSKVKHSIAKVKKAIIGKSSHPKTSSPNQKV